MSEEVEKHILRKYEIAQKLGKGVRGAPRRGRERDGPAVTPPVVRSSAPA